MSHIDENNEWVSFAVGVLLIWGGVQLWDYVFPDTPKTSYQSSSNWSDCSQYTDLIHRKIKESDRVLKNESYTLNEIFYSPRMNTCLYAFTVHTSQMYGGYDFYLIYDFFGGAIFGGSVDTDFQVKIIDLKR